MVYFLQAFCMVIDCLLSQAVKSLAPINMALKIISIFPYGLPNSQVLHAATENAHNPLEF